MSHEILEPVDFKQILVELYKKLGYNKPPWWVVGRTPEEQTRHDEFMKRNGF